jgi:ankyrin repeat protein
MAKLLIDKGADVNAPAADGSTPLHIAVLGSAVL